jgi:type II secretory pathway component GspD/PulD (secretin)
MRDVGHALPLLLLAFACNSPGEPSSDGPSPAASSGEAVSANPPSPRGATRTQAVGDVDLQADLDRLSLEEQKKILLVEQHLADAKDLIGRGFIEEAGEQAARARMLDPDNLEAAKLSATIASMLGDSSGEVGALADEMADRQAIRVQQLRAAAEEYLRKGKVLAGRGDYDEAIAEFSLCLDHIRWAPYSIDWGGVREQAEAELADARARRAMSADEARAEAQRAAMAELREHEEAERARRQQRVASILHEGYRAFRLEDYEAAQQYAQQALAEDPRNERAATLRDDAFRAGREKVRADFLVRKREQYTRWEEEMDELLIPYTNLITLPDAETWRKNSEARAKRSGVIEAGANDAGTRALRAQLAATRVPALAMEQEESLRAVVDTVRTMTGLPLVVDPLAESAAFDEGAIFDFTLNNPLPVINVLDLIADYAGPEVAWTIKHDAVLFTTREKVRGSLTIHNHTVQDLIFGLTDFLGPRINRLRLLDELEDDDGGGPFGGLGERPVIIEQDQLTSLVTENVAKDSWDGDGVSIEIFEGNMIVVQTTEVQRKIEKFLEDLRLFSSSMVTIESKFMTIEDNWLQEIGVEFRGIDNPGIPFTDLDDVTNGLEDNASLGLDNGGTGVVNNASGAPSAGFFYDDGEDGNFKGATSNIFGEAIGNALSSIGGLTAQWSILDDAQVSVILRMIEKSSQIELINDQMLSVQNTQRAYVTVINQRAYIQDFDVEVAQFEAIADPQINVLHEGIVLDVRPTIHHDRKYLTLELQPTVAKVVAIRPFSTGLGSNTSPVEFQLPELEVQSIFTTAVIPDGGSILIGGLSRIRQIERRAEVPWLANIPILGILFKEEGYNDEKKSLMVMIRAWITDVRQELSRIER